jgi:hypothetical protein
MSVCRIYIIILALRHHFYVTLGKTSPYNFFLTMHATGALTCLLVAGVLPPATTTATHNMHVPWLIVD